MEEIAKRRLSGQPRHWGGSVVMWRAEQRTNPSEKPNFGSTGTVTQLILFCSLQPKAATVKDGVCMCMVEEYITVLLQP